MRSKCRCSCVLQFTFRRAVSCVLHRPPSQVIHCTVLFFQKNIVALQHQAISKQFPNVDIPSLGWATLKLETRRRTLARRLTRLGPHQGQTRAASEPGKPGFARQNMASSGAGRQARAPSNSRPRQGPGENPKIVLFQNRTGKKSQQSIDNDPSAGSPTETLLRLLLPLNAQVWRSSRTAPKT